MLQQTSAIHIEAMGAKSSLKLAPLTLPHAGADQVLIKVVASGVNRPDLLQRAGHYPPPEGASEILGLEAAGEIIHVGHQVRRWKVGDKVMALLSGGGYAGHVIAQADACLPWPDVLSAAEAACLPEALFTAWFNLTHHGRLKSGETCLIHGAAGGVGHIAIQLARQMKARPFAVVSSNEKAAFCKALGAEIALNMMTDDFSTALEKTYGANCIDVTLDMLGGDMIGAHLSLAAPQGRIVMIAFLNGALAEIDVKPLMFKQLVLTGSTLRSQPNEVKALLANEIEAALMPAILNRQIVPHVSHTLPLSEAAKAHELLKGRGVLGKIALMAE